MYILQIEVSDLTHSAHEGRSQGFVSFQTETGQVQMHCAVTKVTQKSGPKALVSEALRQLRRMPEYRTGRKAVSFAPGLLGADPTIA